MKTLLVTAAICTLVVCSASNDRKIRDISGLSHIGISSGYGGAYGGYGTAAAVLRSETLGENNPGRSYGDSFGPRYSSYASYYTPPNVISVKKVPMLIQHVVDIPLKTPPAEVVVKVVAAPNYSAGFNGYGSGSGMGSGYASLSGYSRRSGNPDVGYGFGYASSWW